MNKYKVNTLFMALSLTALQGCLPQEDSTLDASKNEVEIDSSATANTDSTLAPDSTLDSTLDMGSSDTNACGDGALSADAHTLHFFELNQPMSSGTSVPGVCGNALSLQRGESVSLEAYLDKSMPQGTVEFWFRPGTDITSTPTTLLGNDGARIHFFYADGALYFQKNVTNQHIFVKASVTLDKGWNLIAGQWNENSMSLWLNGKQLVQADDDNGYQPSPRASIENLLRIGSKSYCCMEGPGYSQAMTTSGSFDQIRISDTTRYMASPRQLIVQPAPEYIQDAQIYVGKSANNLVNINSGKSTCVTAAAYDANTIMRTLVSLPLPQDIDAEKIMSAKLVLTVGQWTSKHTSANVTIRAHKILQSWNEGEGYSTGCTVTSTTTNSATVDGVTGSERSWGMPWNAIGLGLDDKDAASTATSATVLTSGSLDSVSFDITETAKDWVKNPSSNYGVVLVNSDEQSGAYPDIPIFISSENAQNTLAGPRIVLELRD